MKDSWKKKGEEEQEELEEGGKKENERRENGPRDYVAGPRSKNSTHFELVVCAGRYSRIRVGPSFFILTINLNTFLIVIFRPLLIV